MNYIPKPRLLKKRSYLGLTEFKKEKPKFTFNQKLLPVRHTLI